MTMQSDIARKFDLPERQSKLATMLREEGLRDEQVYCICRSTDVNRFMIGCDRCEEWYHGDCINVTEQQANTIRKFYCWKCQEKNPGLIIKYKLKKPHHHEKHELTHRSEQKHGRHSKSDKKSSRCGECEACYVREDCGRCEPCKDKPKFGGPGKLCQKCKKRQCVNFYHLAKKNKEYGRSDHTYISSGKNSSGKKSVIVTPLPNETKPMSPVATTPREKTPPPYVPVAAIKPERPTVFHEQQQQQCRKKVYEQDSEWIPGESVFRSRNSDNEDLDRKKRKISHKETKHQKKNEAKPGRKRKARKVSSSDSDDARTNLCPEPTLDTRPRQCFGPQCVEAAKSGSKYCSDDCGLKLAEARIYSVLPQRIQEWHMKPCISTERDRKKLENLREQQQAARDELRQLDLRHKELDDLMERVNAIPPLPAGEAEEEEDTDYALVYCVTCGHEIVARKALRHMHHCYNKLESQMSFGSMYKTRIEGNNMFCDFYNPLTFTYCKRLRVMCPEHVKDPKVSSNEVCGFPLVEDIFNETDQVCRVAKKICTRHYLWEKLRRATIDMERVRQCLRLDELVEQERATRSAMTNRAGVLGLMLHSTYNHPLLDKFQKHRQFNQGQVKSNNNNERTILDSRELSSSSITHQKQSHQRKISGSLKTTLPAVQINVQKPNVLKVVHTATEQKSDHPYHRHPFNTDKPKPRIIKAVSVKGSQKYVVDQSVDVIGGKRTHDHLYSSNPVAVKKHQDHMYYTNKYHK